MAAKSDLQKLQSKTVWARKFILQKFSIWHLHPLAVSSKTKTLVARYNITVKELQDSIDEDYKTHKKHILDTRKNHLP